MTTSSPAVDTRTHCRVEDLIVEYRRGRGLGGSRNRIRVLDRVSFSVDRGRTLGLVGESGCGKTTTGRAVVRLLEPTGGRVVIDGVDVTALQGRALREARRGFQMIFQDPSATMDPTMTVADSIAEPLLIHGVSGREARSRVRDLIADVGLAEASAGRRPAELSGGQRQRVAIARALALRPGLIVCDEPTSALDVSVQAQVVNLLQELQTEHGLTYIFISHDLSVVRHLSSSIAVMYLGRIIEITTPDGLIDDPLHPYTRALLDVVPSLETTPETIAARAPLAGDVPAIDDPPSGCRFRTRCAFATDICAAQEPVTETVDQHRQVACHHWRTIRSDREAPAGRQSSSNPEGPAL